MSFESNEDRLERLEKSTAEMLQTQKRLARITETLNLQDSRLLKVCVVFKNELLAMARFLEISSLGLDETTRQDFRKQIAKMETDFDMLEAELAEKTKTASGGAPPPI